MLNLRWCAYWSVYPTLNMKYDHRENVSFPICSLSGFRPLRECARLFINPIRQTVNLISHYNWDLSASQTNSSCSSRVIFNLRVLTKSKLVINQRNTSTSEVVWRSNFVSMCVCPYSSLALTDKEKFKPQLCLSVRDNRIKGKRGWVGACLVFGAWNL